MMTFPIKQNKYQCHIDKLVSLIGSFIAIAAIIFTSRDLFALQSLPMIVASMGASAVLLFAVPQGKLSQPRALIGGHSIAAIVGVTCAQGVADPLIAAALAVSVAIILMQYCDCVHPPGGATALTAVVGGQEILELGYIYVFIPVLLNIFVILVIALLFNNLFSWRRYPVKT